MEARTRRIPVPLLTGTGILVISLLLAGIGYFAFQVIGQTVLDDLRSQQLQTTTAVSQQTENYFNGLNVEIIGLSQQVSIRTTQDVSFPVALTTIENTVINRGSVIISVTRFDGDGNPYYAYPEEINGLINMGTYPYDIPQSLKDEADRRVDIEIQSRIHRVERLDRPGDYSYLLIAPVITLNENTEFLVYELNMDAIFNETMDLAVEDLHGSSTGQLWVLDYDPVTETYLDLYSVRDAPSVDTIRDAYNNVDLDAIDSAVAQTYIHNRLGNEIDREAALVRSESINYPFVFLMSRDQSEATDPVRDELRFITFGTIGALAVLMIVGFLGTRILVRETTERQQEAGARATARALLEVSRVLNSTLDLEIVLNRILIELENLLPYFSSSILLIGEDTDDGLSVAAHRGEDAEAHQRTFTWEEAKAAREVVARGHAVIINDTRLDDRWTNIEGNQEIRSWLGLPLKIFNRTVGVLNVNVLKADRFSREDIDLGEAFADQASIALQNARLHQMEVKYIEQELTIARNIQESLQPTVAPESDQLEFAFESIAAQQVSGDFFQIIPLVDNQLAAFVGDVSGKGMPAAMVMAVVTTALRDEVTRVRTPGKLLSVLNERLIDRLKQNNMNSALLPVVYDPSTQHLAISNAGMGLPYVRDVHGEWTEIEIGGYPLGSSETANYGQRSVHFGKNSMIVLYSDGIIEAQNPHGEFFGFDRLEKMLKELPKKITAEKAVKRILEAVNRHLGDAPPQDDVTVMVIRSIAEELAPVTEVEDNDGEDGEDLFEIQSSKQSGSSEEWQQNFLSRREAQIESEGYIMPRENVEVFLPSTLGYEKVARDAAETIAREMGFSNDRIEDLKTAVAEACMNAIEHGNMEDRATSVTVLLSAASDSLEIRIQDRGRQVIPNPLPLPGGSDKSRGWGMFFIQSLMDEVEFTELPEGGNLVKMTIFLGTDDEDADDIAE